MTVTAIESVTRHKMRVSLDGEPAFVFTDREIREWNLTEEMEFDRAEEEALVQYVCREAARTAMNLLVKRDYAQAELYRKLRERGYSEYFARQGIAYVSSYHYLDDERYASQMIGSYKGTASRKMMMNKMKQKGLSDDVIREVMEASEWTDEMGITRELHRRFLSAEQIEEMADKERQKLIQSLMRKGYGYGDITHVMRYFGEIDQERV